MNDSDKIKELEARLLFLEAITIKYRADFEAIGGIVLSFLEQQGAKYRGADGTEKSAADYNTLRAAQNLRDALAHLADGDPSRASQISNILKQPLTDDKD